MKKSDKTNVSLKEFQESDLKEFYRIAKNEEVKKFVKLFYPENFEETHKIFELSKNTKYVIFKIVDINDEILGAIAGEKIGRKTMEVSYFIGARHRGRGYCTSALKLFKKYVKENTNCRTLKFRIASNNRKSQEVMNRLNISHKYTGIYKVYELEI